MYLPNRILPSVCVNLEQILEQHHHVCCNTIKGFCRGDEMNCRNSWGERCVTPSAVTLFLYKLLSKYLMVKPVQQKR